MGVFETADAIAVAIANPALGPSLGMAPSGTCTWISFFSKKSLRTFNWRDFERTHDSAARPDEGAVASCELTTTGVTMRYYEGADLDKAERDCDAMEAEFQRSSR